MYTICYVLTDSPKLSIFNEMKISIASLRYYGNHEPVLVITDEATQKLLYQQQEFLNKYKVDIKAVEIPGNYNQKEKSRFLKTSLRQHLSGDYLFVDTDTVFADKLPDIISIHELAMVTDHHEACLSLQGKTYSFEKKFMEQQCRELLLGEAYFNSGIAWVKDTENVRMFYKMWHEEWKERCIKGVVQDQTSLNFVNQRLGKMISHLDDKYNVQVSDGEYIPFNRLNDAIIIHYFHPTEGNREYLLAFPEVRQNKLESDIIQNIIMSPKSAFFEGKLLDSNKYKEYRDISSTYQYGVMYKLYSYNGIFSKIEKVLSVFFHAYNWLKKILFGMKKCLNKVRKNN